MSLIEEFCCTLIILISSAVIIFSEVCCEVDHQMVLSLPKIH